MLSLRLSGLVVAFIRRSLSKSNPAARAVVSMIYYTHTRAQHSQPP